MIDVPASSKTMLKLSVEETRIAWLEKIELNLQSNENSIKSQAQTMQLSMVASASILIGFRSTSFRCIEYRWWFVIWNIMCSSAAFFHGSYSHVLAERQLQNIQFLREWHATQNKVHSIVFERGHFKFPHIHIPIEKYWKWQNKNKKQCRTNKQCQFVL